MQVNPLALQAIMEPSFRAFMSTQGTTTPIPTVPVTPWPQDKQPEPHQVLTLQKQLATYL